jgi:tetratricopeptide (TPR) repeat protein
MHQEAIRVYDRAQGVLYPHFLVQHAEILLLAMLIDAASDRARQALDLTRERGERGYEAYALRLLGEIATSADRPDLEAGHGLYEQARGLATALGMRPLVAHCHLGLGKLSLQTGSRQEAQEHLATATAMYREMDMRFWLEQAEAERRS